MKKNDFLSCSGFEAWNLVFKEKGANKIMVLIPRSGESESDDSDGSDDASIETSDADDEEVLTVSDINVGDFALVKYKYSHSIKYYIGECMEKDTSGEISFIFLERICGSLFKYRENVIRETANISMVKNILAAPSVTRRGGKLDFKSSKEVIDRLRCLY